MDDGKPATGRAFALNPVSRALSVGNGDGFITATTNNCVHSGDYYTNSSTYANAGLCSLRLDFQ
jgi:hypothetical protein